MGDLQIEYMDDFPNYQPNNLRKDDFDETKESGELISQKGGELDYKNLVSKLE